jgi:hypothetical protein
VAFWYLFLVGYGCVLLDGITLHIRTGLMHLLVLSEHVLSFIIIYHRTYFAFRI